VGGCAHGCPRRRPVCCPFPRLGFAARGRSRWAVSGNPSGIPGSYVRRGGTREGVMMGGSRPARRRSGGGRDGGWGLRLVAVDGCGAAGRSTGSAWARAAAPGSLAAGHFQRTSILRAEATARPTARRNQRIPLTRMRWSVTPTQHAACSCDV
jgi:hypothetical protein